MSDDSGAASSDISELLAQTLAESQRLGFLGSRPVAQVVAHARYFVEALTAAGVPAHDVSILDLGAGGGLPGLVIAHDLPGAQVTLLDRRQTRTDFLARAVRRLQWNDRVVVLTQDAARPAGHQSASFDVAVARGFGPPALTLGIATRWVRSGGHIAISEPPHGDRWAATDLAPLEVERCISPAQVALFRRR